MSCHRTPGITHLDIRSLLGRIEVVGAEVSEVEIEVLDSEVPVEDLLDVRSVAVSPRVQELRISPLQRERRPLVVGARARRAVVRPGPVPVVVRVPSTLLALRAVDVQDLEVSDVSSVVDLTYAGGGHAEVGTTGPVRVSIGRAGSAAVTIQGAGAVEVGARGKAEIVLGPAVLSTVSARLGGGATLDVHGTLERAVVAVRNQAEARFHGPTGALTPEVEDAATVVLFASGLCYRSSGVERLPPSSRPQGRPEVGGPAGTMGR